MYGKEKKEKISMQQKTYKVTYDEIIEGEKYVYATSRKVKAADKRFGRKAKNYKAILSWML